MIFAYQTHYSRYHELTICQWRTPLWMIPIYSFSTDIGAIQTMKDDTLSIRENSHTYLPVQ